MREIIARGGAVQATAVVEDGVLVEYLEDETDASADTVFLGKVVRVVPGLLAAFVDIGEEKNGFLPMEEKKLTDGAYYTGLNPKMQPGDRVLVQIRREAMGTKGAFLSRDISLPGSLVILMPRNSMVGVSSRISSDRRREELKLLGNSIARGQFGLVMRTSAENAEAEEIIAEIEDLQSQWKQISEHAAVAHAPSVIYRKPGSVDSLITDYAPKGIDLISTNEQRIYDAYHTRFQVVKTEEDPIAARGLERAVGHALDRRVWLKNGGNLVIDECEALTVIDVNTAKNTGSRKDRAVLMHTNMEACHEIARQLRLRNLGGIILIDMIDMESDDEREAILETLKADLQKDRIKTVIHGFTSLGLIEMTRRRSHRRLKDSISKVCPVCRGTGSIIRHFEEENDPDANPMVDGDREEGETSCPSEADN